MPRKWLIAALCLPLIVLAFGIVRAERHVARSKRWVFDVTGYDPRDLLRGHYIQYRLDLHEPPGAVMCSGENDTCCLCLRETSPGKRPSVERLSCDVAASQCDGRLRTRYLSELQRYYIPEGRARELTELLQKAASESRAQLAVLIDGNGKPQIEALLVDGRPIEQSRPAH